VLPNIAERVVTSARTLTAQLAAAGYAPADITYLALSHYHYDHTANANLFAASTWLVRPVERDAMFAAKPPDLLQPSTYSALRNSKTVAIRTDDHDVFGDGTGAEVVARSPPGHQVLFEAREHGPDRRLRRSLSLSGGTHARGFRHSTRTKSGRGLTRGADVSEADGASSDPARLQREREVEEGAGYYDYASRSPQRA
jgi:hypothetical protein